VTYPVNTEAGNHFRFRSEREYTLAIGWVERNIPDYVVNWCEERGALMRPIGTYLVSDWKVRCAYAYAVNLLRPLNTDVNQTRYHRPPVSLPEGVKIVAPKVNECMYWQVEVHGTCIAWFAHAKGAEAFACLIEFGPT